MKLFVLKIELPISNFSAAIRKEVAETSPSGGRGEWRITFKFTIAGRRPDAVSHPPYEQGRTACYVGFIRAAK
jgi:hypothetical protein